MTSRYPSAVTRPRRAHQPCINLHARLLPVLLAYCSPRSLILIDLRQDKMSVRSNSDESFYNKTVLSERAIRVAIKVSSIPTQPTDSRCTCCTCCTCARRGIYSLTAASTTCIVSPYRILSAFDHDTDMLILMIRLKIRLFSMYHYPVPVSFLKDTWT